MMPLLLQAPCCSVRYYRSAIPHYDRGPPGVCIVLLRCFTTRIINRPDKTNHSDQRRHVVDN